MAKLLEDGHAGQPDSNEVDSSPGKTWYQSHFCVKCSKKIRVVFDCAA